MTDSQPYPTQDHRAARRYDEGQYDEGEYGGEHTGSNVAENRSMAGPLPGERTIQSRDGESEGLDESLVSDAAGFQQRWDSIKVAFVDDPRRAVAEAEALLGEVVEDMLGGFRRDREQLEANWERGDEGSTEHLRRSLRRYRSFYERLLQPQSGV